MDDSPQDVPPIITPIRNGFAARGHGWAVHGHTEAEALDAYDTARARHREMDQRPLPAYVPPTAPPVRHLAKHQAALDRVLWMLEHQEMCLEDLDLSLRQRLQRMFSTPLGMEPHQSIQEGAYDARG